MILAGELAPGERLPPERALAERFAVNRVTLRSALARVAAAGLLEVRQGRGYTVRDFRRVGGPDLLVGLAQLARGESRLAAVAADLLLVRRSLARAVVARLLEERPELGEIRAAVARFSALAESGAGPAALAEADAGVVAALLAATGSPVLQLCLNPVRVVLAELPELRAAMFRAPAENAAGWRALVAMLEAPSPPPGALEILDALLLARDAATVAALEVA
jgi:GntR family transcriptional repressor for pyruvate dehydrogenase complex